MEEKRNKELVPTTELGYSPSPIPEKILNTRWYQSHLDDVMSLNESFKDLTLEEKQKLIKLIRPTLNGSCAVVPMKCGGEDKCFMWNSCVFYALGKDPPLGERCPLEMMILADSPGKYAADLDVKEGDYVDQRLVMKLVELDIYDYRLTAYLQDPDRATLIEDLVIGMDDDNNLIKGRQISRAFELKERLNYRRERILKALVGTRYEDYKRKASLKIKDTDNFAENASATKEQYDQMIQKLKNS